MNLYHEDGRLYPNVKFFSQVTGRSAYAGPVLQNIGKSLDLPGMEGTSFRDCILAPEGSSMVKADYSAQELRILAHAEPHVWVGFVPSVGAPRHPRVGRELLRRS